MAVAEAKLLESGVLLPTYTAGGNYAISRVAPYTIDYALWGTDYERYHQALVCTEFIEAEHSSEMKAKWNELRGTGTYEEWAKSYLKEKGYTLKDEYSLTFTITRSSVSKRCSSLISTVSGSKHCDCRLRAFYLPLVQTSLRPSPASCLGDEMRGFLMKMVPIGRRT